MANTTVENARPIDKLLAEYGESHQNATNKTIHWICVPTIMFSLLGLFYSIPFPGGTGLFTNWAMVLVILTLIYYLTLSIPMFLGFIFVGGAMALGNHFLAEALAPLNIPYVFICLAIFFLAWVGQFIGHNIEGKKPSFLKDLQFLLVGPAWLMHFIFKKVGIKY
jgi:uncharacterized membrane protein YGL010W